MSLIQEFKDQFEEKYRDIVSSEYNSTVSIDDEDLTECFKDVMINDIIGDVDQAVNEAIIDWINENKRDEIDIQDIIDNIEAEIEEKETEIKELQEELKDLTEEVEADISQETQNDTWDTITSSRSDKW